MQARRASSSRTSVGFSTPNKGIMVGEAQSGASLLREKYAEITELRARIDDKDRMLAALRSAARSRDTAEAHNETRASQLFEHSPHQQQQQQQHAGQPSSPLAANGPHSSGPKKRTKSVDEMSRMLDEMIQDRVETGHIIRGVRGSVRVANDRKLEAVVEPAAMQLETLRQSPTLGGDDSQQPVAVEA